MKEQKEILEQEGTKDPKGNPIEAPKKNPKETPKKEGEDPKENPKETPKTPKKEGKDPKENPKENPKEAPKEEGGSGRGVPMNEEMLGKYKEIEEILVGTLLGDASMQTYTDGRTWRVRYIQKDEAYIQHLYEK